LWNKLHVVAIDLARLLNHNCRLLAVWTVKVGEFGDENYETHRLRFAAK